MLMPNKMKYRKHHLGRLKGEATTCNTLEFGDFGMVAMDKARITSRQIEAARIAVNRYLRRGGKLVIRIFPHLPVTRKAAETRQGSGKGAVEYYAAPVKKGTIMYELSGVTREQAKEAFRRAGHKLPVKVKFVFKEGTESAEVSK